MGAIDNIYTIAAATLSGATIDQITDVGYDPQFIEAIIAADGIVDPVAAAILGASPRFNFSSTNVKQCLAELGGIGGIALEATDKFFWQKVTPNGTRASSPGAHISMTTAGGGLIVPQSLSAQQGQPATISYLVVCISADGTTSPFTVATSSVSLPATAAAQNIHTLGEVSVNGTLLNGVTSWTLNFGITLIGPIAADGHTFPTFVAIGTRQPTIDIDTHDLDEWATWTDAGAGLGLETQTSTDSTVKLREVDENGIIASGSDIVWTMDEGIPKFMGLSGSHGQPIGGRLMLTPTFDGTAAILALTIP